MKPQKLKEQRLKYIQKNVEAALASDWVYSVPIMPECVQELLSHIAWQDEEFESALQLDSKRRTAYVCELQEERDALRAELAKRDEEIISLEDSHFYREQLKAQLLISNALRADIECLNVTINKINNRASEQLDVVRDENAEYKRMIGQNPDWYAERDSLKAEISKGNKMLNMKIDDWIGACKEIDSIKAEVEELKTENCNYLKKLARVPLKTDPKTGEVFLNHFAFEQERDSLKATNEKLSGGLRENLRVMDCDVCNRVEWDLAIINTKKLLGEGKV